MIEVRVGTAKLAAAVKCVHQTFFGRAERHKYVVTVDELEMQRLVHVDLNGLCGRGPGTLSVRVPLPCLCDFFPSVSARRV